MIHKPTGATDDPLWLIAFPIYYAFGLLYGAFAAIYYLPSFRQQASGDPVLAQLFGILIAVACTVGLIGSLTTIFRGNPRIEEIGAITFTVLMVAYFLSLTYLVGILHDPGTRPGSSFVPMLFAVFPAIRSAVIRRRRHVEKGRA